MRALITGVLGQDGVYLSSFLSERGYDVYGVDKPEKYAGAHVRATLKTVDLTNKKELYHVLDDIQPHEIYHLAAFVSDSEYRDTYDAQLFGVSNMLHVQVPEYFLSWIKYHSPQTRFFYASTSHVFDNMQQQPQTENTPYNPRTFYALTKLFGQQLCQYYRRQHNIFASVGILYNHESPLRSEDYVTKKIATSAAQSSPLALRNLAARVDWGYAGDFVEAMHVILQHHVPDDFIISSGTTHSVQEFVEEAFMYLGHDWREYVDGGRQESRAMYWGNITKLTQATGWRPRTDFRSLVRLMVDAQKKPHAH